MSIPDSYRTLTAATEGLYKDKGSKFIACAHPVKDLEEIKFQLDLLKGEHPKARHICYAYRLGFTPEEAAAYEKQPQRIANRIYGNRMGNRDEASGDGFRFRGSGFLQLTGHSNFFHAGQALGEDFVMQPELVRTPKYAAMTAGWFWQTHKLNQYADSRDFLMMTKRINGGTIGLDDRIKHINLVFNHW